MDPQLGNHFSMCLYGKSIFKIFLSITIGSEKLNSTSQLSDLVQSKFTRIVTPEDGAGLHEGKLFLHVFI
jgi:hypothetical protein